MVVGTGLLATAFFEYKNKDDIIIFASGVSNSKETSKEQFLREEKLLCSYLEKYGNSKHFIYFSTCSMYDTYFERSAYTTHKMNMEKIIIDRASRYNIFRLPQVLGKNNKNQLIGFLYKAINNNISFDLYDIERNIIDIDDVYLIIDEILNNNSFKNKIMNIANFKNIRVIDLVNILEKLIDKKAKYKIVEKEGEFKIYIGDIEKIIIKLNIFEKNYLENRIRKYYG